MDVLEGDVNGVKVETGSRPVGSYHAFLLDSCCRHCCCSYFIFPNSLTLSLPDVGAQQTIFNYKVRDWISVVLHCLKTRICPLTARRKFDLKLKIWTAGSRTNGENEAVSVAAVESDSDAEKRCWEPKVKQSWLGFWTCSTASLRSSLCSTSATVITCAFGAQSDGHRTAEY